MSKTVKTFSMVIALVVGLTGAAAAYTHHLSYPISTPYNAPRGTVEFCNRGSLTADIYIDGAYLGQLQPGDRAIVHDVWAGETEVRWEYTFNYDGESEHFYLDPCERRRWVFRPEHCGYGGYQPVPSRPTYNGPVYPQPVYNYPTYTQITPQPVYCPPSYGPNGNWFEIRDDDFYLGLSGNGFAIDFD